MTYFEKIDFHFFDQIFVSVENTLCIVTLEIRLIYLLVFLTGQCKTQTADWE